MNKPTIQSNSVQFLAPPTKSRSACVDSRGESLLTPRDQNVVNQDVLPEGAEMDLMGGGVYPWEPSEYFSPTLAIPCLLAYYYLKQMCTQRNSSAFVVPQ